MKSFLNWLRDSIYDSIDYIIMLVIIVSVVFIIGWRLDILFANDATDIPHKNTIISDADDSPKNPTIEKPDESNNAKDPEPTDVNPADPEDPLGDTEQPSNPVPETPTVEDTPPVVEVASIVITIPPGSLPSKIGDILESNGLIASKKDFVSKSQELKLDTKLKSGTFKIPNNSSMEQVLNIITK